MEAGKYFIDLASVGVVVTTLNDLLPPIAALFTIVWTIIRIYETKTVQSWLAKRQQKHTRKPK